MCWASFEYFCKHGGLIRVYADGQSTDDPYCFALPFQVINDKIIELKGVWACPRQCQIRTITRSCRKAGLTVVRERKSGANPGYKCYK